MAYINGKEILFTPIGGGSGTTDIVVPDKNTSERGSAGLVYMYNESSGLRLDGDQRLCIAPASEADIDAGTSNNKPIVPAFLPYAFAKYGLNFKLHKIPKGETFAIKPGMMGIILPSTTLSAHVGSPTASATVSSMGTTIFMATDTGADTSNPDSHWLALLYVSSISMKSNHNVYTSTCYIKNDDTSSSGTYAYVYYIERN